MDGPMTSVKWDYIKLSPEEIHIYLEDGQLVMDEAEEISEMVNRIFG